MLLGLYFEKSKLKKKELSILTLYLIEKPFNTFANRADPDQAALVRAAGSVSTLFAYGNVIEFKLKALQNLLCVR